MELDFDPAHWTGREFVDYRKAVGEDLATSMAKIAESDGSSLPVDAIYGVAWITARRADPGLTYDDVLDAVKFGDLVDAMEDENPTEAAPAAAVSSSTTGKSGRPSARRSPATGGTTSTPLPSKN